MPLTLTVVLGGLAAAFVFGLSKTSVPSAGSFGVALLATVLPPLASTGVALPVLLVGDLVALALYARHADRGLLVRLLPSVVVGLAAGFALVRVADTTLATRVIGVVLLLSAAGAVLRGAALRRLAGARDDGDGGADDDGAAGTDGAAARSRDALSLVLGAGAGLSTMVANAGGPMMTLYLLRMRIGTFAFLGTVAWFFFAVNLLKLPFSIGLGLVTPESLRVSAAIAPGIVVGALVGRRLVTGMSRVVFERVALVATAAAGAWLVVA